MKKSAILLLFVCAALVFCFAAAQNDDQKDSGILDRLVKSEGVASHRHLLMSKNRFKNKFRKGMKFNKNKRNKKDKEIWTTTTVEPTPSPSMQWTTTAKPSVSPTEMARCKVKKSSYYLSEQKPFSTCSYYHLYHIKDHVIITPEYNRQNLKDHLKCMLIRTDNTYGENSDEIIAKNLGYNNKVNLGIGSYKLKCTMETSSYTDVRCENEIEIIDDIKPEIKCLKPKKSIEILHKGSAYDKVYVTINPYFSDNNNKCGKKENKLVEAFCYVNGENKKYYMKKSGENIKILIKKYGNSNIKCYIEDEEGNDNECEYHVRVKTCEPTSSPSKSPTTSSPTSSPSVPPTTSSPTPSPSHSPTTSSPTPNPSNSPTTSSPTPSPSTSPTTSSPTPNPSKSPTTSSPTPNPSKSPTTSSPTPSPSGSPTTSSPTPSPSQSPSTSSPTPSPSQSPSTSLPTPSPSNSPTTSSPTPYPTSWTGMTSTAWAKNTKKRHSNWKNGNKRRHTKKPLNKRNKRRKQ